MLLDSAIRSTIAFFDIFDYPLTSFEVWQYLPLHASLNEVQTALEDASLILDKKDGLYALPGRLAHLEAERRRRYISTDRKIKKAKRLIRLFSWLPWIKLICLANTIGTHNLRAGGDIDLFIVTKPQRLWLSKLFASSITQLTGLRPRQGHNRDKLCLSFFVDESALNLATFRLGDDHYFPYWLAGLLPLYGDSSVYDNLIAANSWITEALPNWSTACSRPRLRFNEAIKRADWLSWLSGFEQISRKLQKTIMSPDIKAIANLDTRVVINDHVLKLHTVDRREYFKTEHIKRLAS